MQVGSCDEAEEEEKNKMRLKMLMIGNFGWNADVVWRFTLETKTGPEHPTAQQTDRYHGLSMPLGFISGGQPSPLMDVWTRPDGPQWQEIKPVMEFPAPAGRYNNPSYNLESRINSTPTSPMIRVKIPSWWEWIFVKKSKNQNQLASWWLHLTGCWQDWAPSNITELS
jgi:hypothetical protein